MRRGIAQRYPLIVDHQGVADPVVKGPVPVAVLPPAGNRCPTWLLRYRPTVSRYRTVKNPGRGAVFPNDPQAHGPLAKMLRLLPGEACEICYRYQPEEDCFAVKHKQQRPVEDPVRGQVYQQRDDAQGQKRGGQDQAVQKKGGGRGQKPP